MKFILAADEHVFKVWELYKTAICALNARGSDQWGDFYPTYELICQDIRDRTMMLLIKNDEILVAGVLNTIGSPEYDDIKWIFDEPFAYVHRVAVHGHHHGEGLSTIFMEHIHKHAIFKGFRTIRLDTREDNAPALNLYASFGYITRGTVMFSHESFKKFPCMELDLTKI